MPGDGKCMVCGAQVRPRLSNCDPPVKPCEQCGQCSCLARDVYSLADLEGDVLRQVGATRDAPKGPALKAVPGWADRNGEAS